MTFEDRFKELLAEYLTKYHGLTVAEIITYEQDRVTVSACDTCGYSQTVIRVHYVEEVQRSRRRPPPVHTFELVMNFSDLIMHLSMMEE